MGQHYLQQELVDLMKSDAGIFSFIENAAIDGIWFWDLEDPENEWMSPKFWQTFGIDPATKEHKAHEWQQLIFPEDLVLALDNFQKHADNPDHPYDQIVRYRHADGSVVWIRCRGIAIRREDGTPIRMLGTHNDITPLMAEQEKTNIQMRSEIRSREKSLEQAKELLHRKNEEISALNADLRASSENQSTILGGMASAILVVGHDQQIMYVNAAACDMFGYSEEEFLKESISQLVPRSSREHHHSLVEGYAKAPMPMVMGNDSKVYGVTKSGHKIALELALNPISFNGVDGVLVNAVDISARVKGQLQLEKFAAALERSNSELDAFARIIAHDLRDPIGRVQTLAEAIELNLKNDRPDRALGMVDILKQTSEHSIELITDLYTYASVQAGLPDDSALLPISLQGSLKQALHNVGDKLSGVTIHTDDTDCQIMATESFVVQVIQNILSNALKYGAQTAPEISCKIEETPVSGILSITDNGPGIPKKSLLEIFQPFTRLKSNVQKPGLGLGLATAEKIMTHLEGRIWCENAEEGGARFCLEFPKANSH
ncbi:hypothetical protein GCM10017044_04640 [Kordiimonas sediminis]|uniref:histidine kinase n=1 Tax=Kordiimonas sediminis TaxID=1735581 RepID=A0A919ALL7_9PROT|nr:PAS domain S-box protein [Kordiimonas sediminis]GHF13635.1 hypothetical protein GCM10017044_04640 [Kordiimonas sediminis]